MDIPALQGVGIGTLLLGAAVICATAPLMYILRRMILQRGLRIVPGPPSPSFLKGAWTTRSTSGDMLIACVRRLDIFLIGNLSQMFSPDSSPFHDEMNKRYGRLIRMAGFCGVLPLLPSTCAVSAVRTTGQRIGYF